MSPWSLSRLPRLFLLILSLRLLSLSRISHSPLTRLSLVPRLSLVSFGSLFRMARGVLIHVWGGYN